MNADLKPKGRYTFDVYDALGNHIDQRITENLITDLGANHVLDVSLDSTAATAEWYIGLINNTPTPGLLAADTLASHAGWVEFTDYTGNRQEWLRAAAAARVKASSANSVFPILGTATIWGGFVCGAATGTSAILMSEATFAVALPVVNGNTVNVTYTLSYQ